MKYLLLLYTNPDDWAATSEDEMAQVIADHGKLIDELKAGDKYLNSNAPEDASAATTLRVRQRKTLITDGPFAETREQLGGYYLLWAAKADLLRRCDRRSEAARAYRRALDLVPTEPERRFLGRRLAEVESG